LAPSSLGPTNHKVRGSLEIPAEDLEDVSSMELPSIGVTSWPAGMILGSKLFCDFPGIGIRDDVGRNESGAPVETFPREIDLTFSSTAEGTILEGLVGPMSMART